MTKRSAGILLYRRAGDQIQVLLVHPGGPYWRRKDAGSWQISKGEIDEGEDSAAAALRETEEELGVKLRGEPVPLLSIRQAGGKVIEAFALEQDIDPALSTATPSSWNGLPAPARSRPSPRSTALGGSLGRRRKPRCCPVNGRC